MASAGHLPVCHHPCAGEPKLDPALQVSYKCLGEGQDPSPRPAGCSPANMAMLAALAARVFCWLLGNLLFYQVPSCRGAMPTACTTAGSYPTPDVGLSSSRGWTSWGSCQPIFQLVEVPLNSSPALQHVIMLFLSPHTFRECTPVPIQVINKLLSRAGPSVDPQGMPLVTGSQVKVVLLITILWAWHSTVFLPPLLSGYPGHISALWFEGCCGRLSMAFDTKSRCPNTPCSPLSCRASVFVPEGSRASQTWFAFGISILAGFSHLLVLPVLGNGVQDLFCNLSGWRARQLADSQGYSAPLLYI